ncbi:uncharacterized protein J4E88_010151 [Alternaria novae-zelandiae]|uniref:uncharacterized protein n=1 Tax=Alternaria novae-zelandiae TaxID=430562 RepID=UPI0020C20378|nr:uncharacterized protein J4E88_010151 [Alternaria novae-zelandiae]KAI4667750.1 hypothetical protein J4E88_010151 [Alternaria novae-zelandiae]
MSSSQQQSVPRIRRVRELQAYKDWVEAGGLDRFAAEHNVKPDFANRLCDVKPDVAIAFYLKLATIPGLETTMAPPSNEVYAPASYGLQIIQDMENGWSSEDETDDKKAKEQKGGESKDIKDETDEDFLFLAVLSSLRKRGAPSSALSSLAKRYKEA